MIRSRERYVRAALFISLGLILIFELVQLSFIAANLRPVADDYCLAGVAGLNPIDYFKHWRYYFIADISTLAGNYF